MNRLLLCLLALATAVCLLRAADPKPAAKPAAAAPGTNLLVIACDNGVEYTNGRVTYRGNVQVLDADMSLACELLTVYFPTNFGSIDMIVAETNVFITQKDSLAAADRVVYTATNELVTFTGRVILDTPQASLSGEMITYNLKTGAGRIEGRAINIIGLGSGAGFMGTNLFSPTLKPTGK